MNTKASPETASSALDITKWVFVVATIVVVVVGNSYFDEQPFLYRLIGVMIGGVFAALVASQTEKGQAFLALLKDARAEVRRIVWPTRQETLQTTGVVVLFVGIMALILWMLDLGLGALISKIIG